MPTFKPRHTPPKPVKAIRLGAVTLDKIVEFAGPELVEIQHDIRRRTYTLGFETGFNHRRNHGDFLMMKGSQPVFLTREEIGELYAVEHALIDTGGVLQLTPRTTKPDEDPAKRVAALCFDGSRLDAIRTLCGDQLRSLLYEVASTPLRLVLLDWTVIELPCGHYLLRHQGGKLAAMCPRAFDEAYIAAT